MKANRSTWAWRTLWLPFGCLCMLGYGYPSMMKAYEEVEPSWELELLEAEELTDLEPGDRVWVAGLVDALDVDEEEGTLYWEPGADPEEEPFSAADGGVPLRGPGYQAQLILSLGPADELDLFGFALDSVHSYDYSWNSPISAIGSVQSLDPLVVESENHFIASPGTHARTHACCNCSCRTGCG